MGDCPWWHHWYPIELFKVPIILGNIIKNPIFKGYCGTSRRGVGFLLVHRHFRYSCWVGTWKVSFKGKLTASISFRKGNHLLLTPSRAAINQFWINVGRLSNDLFWDEKFNIVCFDFFISHICWHVNLKLEVFTILQHSLVITSKTLGIAFKPSHNMWTSSSS